MLTTSSKESRISAARVSIEEFAEILLLGRDAPIFICSRLSSSKAIRESSPISRKRRAIGLASAGTVRRTLATDSRTRLRTSVCLSSGEVARSGALGFIARGCTPSSGETKTSENRGGGAAPIRLGEYLLPVDVHEGDLGDIPLQETGRASSAWPGPGVKGCRPRWPAVSCRERWIASNDADQAERAPVHRKRLQAKRAAVVRQRVKKSHWPRRSWPGRAFR